MRAYDTTISVYSMPAPQNPTALSGCVYKFVSILCLPGHGEAINSEPGTGDPRGPMNCACDTDSLLCRPMHQAYYRFHYLSSPFHSVYVCDAMVMPFSLGSPWIPGPWIFGSLVPGPLFIVSPEHAHTTWYAI